MADWNEKMLDEELEAIMNDVPEQEDLEKKINQIINRRIRKVVMKTLSAVVIVVLILGLGINPLMNVSFWNPYKMNEDGELLTVFGNFVDMTQPWSELISVDVEKKGFARYEMEMQIADHTEPIYVGMPNVTMDVKRGKYAEIKDPDNRLTIFMGRFDMMNIGYNETVIEHIESLPESAWVYLNLSSRHEQTIEQLQEVGMVVQWLQVYQPTVEFQGGIRITPSVGDKLLGKNFWTISSEELLELYLDNLENLLEHPEVWKQFSLSDGRSWVFAQSEEVLRETYENAKELESVTTKNYCIAGQRDEVLEYLKSREFTNIRVEKVKLSLYE